jgi:hypothetical protein
LEEEEAGEQRPEGDREKKKEEREKRTHQK